MAEAPCEEAKVGLKEIQCNTIYLTFNIPQVNDCHRGILCTDSLQSGKPVSGIRFHVEHDSAVDSQNGNFTEYTRAGSWSFRERPSRNPARAKSLLYAQKIGEIDPYFHDNVLNRIRKALREVPLGKESREATLGRLKDDQGNPDLEGYDCVIWTIDALAKLNELGIIRLDAEPHVVMDRARKSAWPGDIAKLITSG